MQFLRQPKYGFPDSPTYYLEKYKHSVRPRPCVRCGQAAYYWHPDWLHIAEDALGEHKKADLEVPDGEAATEEHAKAAILKHLNDE